LNIKDGNLIGPAIPKLESEKSKIELEKIISRNDKSGG